MGDFDEWNKWNPHLTSGIYEPPKIGCHYSQLSVDWLEKPDVDFIFGSDRRIFRGITRRYQGCLYIWYNSEKKIIEFWTKSMNIAVLVRKALLNRIELKKMRSTSL
jgi:hypothetical protein